MARYKKVNYDQLEMIPINFSEQILEGTFEYTLNYLIEKKIDLSCFDSNYNNDKTGSKAILPSVLLKVILFAYSKGIISSRNIENACRTNIIFKALSANTVPDHSTIAAFVSGMKNQIKMIFQYVLMVCSSSGLIGGEMFAVDGCKITSNASKEWSGTLSELKKKKEKFGKLALMLLNKHQEEDKKGNMEAAEGLKKRVEKMKKKAEKIEEFLKTAEPKMGKRDNEIQSNITDNESAKIKSSHGVIQGYNGLAVVDEKHQVITAAEAFGSGYEGDLLETMADNTNKNLKEVTGETLKDKVLLADTNYFSEENLKKMKVMGINAVIPDNQFRSRDERFKDSGRFKPEKKGLYKREEDFHFDEVSDTYQCPGGKTLKFSVITKIGNFTVRKYICRKSDCQACKKKSHCLSSEKSRYRTLLQPIYAENRNHSDEMRKLIDTPEGRDLYSKRMKIVEPVFGNITYCKGMDRFMLMLK